eukprot:504789-Pleurochrysis_carterae.AAC.1
MARPHPPPRTTGCGWAFRMCAPPEERGVPAPPTSCGAHRKRTCGLLPAHPPAVDVAAVWAWP